MKARLVKRNEQLELLSCNGKIILLDEKEARRFIEFFDDKSYYSGIGKWDYPYSMNEYSGTTLAIVDDFDNLTICSSEFLRTILHTSPIKYLTTAEYAEKYGKKRGIVMRFCREGRLKGAIQKGPAWLIPEDAPYPEDGRRGIKSTH